MTGEQLRSMGITVGTALATLGASVGVVTPEQLAALKTDFAEIGQGLTLLFHGASGAVAIGLVIWTGYRTTKTALAKRVSASPTEQVVTTDPVVKAAVPDAVKVAPGQVAVTLPTSLPPPKA